MKLSFALSGLFLVVAHVMYAYGLLWLPVVYFAAAAFGWNSAAWVSEWLRRRAIDG